MSSQFVPTVPRKPILAMFTTPGPAYGLPGLTGDYTHDPRSVHKKNPSYSFGLKNGKFKDECSPGPVYYPNTRITRSGKDGTPSYSLYARRPYTIKFNTPGAGTYRPEGEMVMEKSYKKMPSYTFGIKHQSAKFNKTPAPNSYSLPSMLSTTVQSGKTQAPIYSLTGRSNIGGFSYTAQKTPGAGTYSIVQPDMYKNKQPHYSMLGRNNMPGDGTRKPGPGSHSPERVHINKRKAPQHSFGIRHSNYTAPLIV